MPGLENIVITGAGVCAPLGHTPAALYDAMLAGECAIGPTAKVDVTPFPCKLSAQVTDFKARDWVSNRKNLKLMSSAVRFGLAAVRRAYADAGLTRDAISPDRLGMYVGAGTALGETRDLIPALEVAFADGTFSAERFGREGIDRISPLWLLKGLSNNVLGFGTADLDARGTNQNYCSSGAGGLQAIGEAAWALAEGKADAVIAGGADSAAEPGHLTGFGRLHMLLEGEDAVMRPFDARRAGFAPGEGAAFFVLERAELAAAAGRKPLARLVGYANGCAGHALPAGDPDTIARTCMAALDRAGWRPEDVDLVQAHGNGTVAYDKTEAAAFREIFGATVPITSNKGHIGHAIAGAGPLSVISALEAARHGLIAPIAGLEQVAPECQGLDLVMGAPREATIRRALVHAAGIGGQTTFICLEFDA